MNYACINDAWGVIKDDKARPIKTNECNNYDSIIDSYLDDFINLKNNKSNKLKSITPSPNTFENDYKQIQHKTDINYKTNESNYNIEPYSKDSNYMDYEDYFSNKNLFGKQKIKKKGMLIEEKSDSQQDQPEQNIYNKNNYNPVSEETFVSDENYNNFSNESPNVVENEPDYKSNFDRYVRSEEKSKNNETSIYQETFGERELGKNNTINDITKNPIIDVIIYTLMGIILIFMLEQIFKLGSMSIKS